MRDETKPRNDLGSELWALQVKHVIVLWNSPWTLKLEAQ